jgi:hypothetical protein
MKNTSRLLILFVIAILYVSCWPFKKKTATEKLVSQLSDTAKVNDGSLVYALPRTVFTVNVEMERQVDMPGPYAKYSEDLLGLKGAIMNTGEHWSIKGISISSHEEADPSEFYVIATNTLFRTNALSLKNEGLILDLNPALNYPDESLVSGKELNINQFRSYDLGSDEYYLTQTDTAYKRIKMDSQFIRIPYTVEKKKKLTDDQLAEKAARRLMDLRDGRILILTGEANVFPQNEAAINEINRLEKEYTELFTGKSFNEKRMFSCQVIPEKENGNKQITMFYFSENAGPVDVSGKSGIAVKMELSPEQKTKDLTIISKQQSEPSEQKFDKLYYRIPDIVNVKLLMGEETLYNSRKLVYQFGEVMQLPANYIIGK